MTETFSVTKLKTATSCPRRFHLRYGLHVAPTSEEVQPKHFGSAFHFIVAEVLRWLVQQDYELGDVSLETMCSTAAETWIMENGTGNLIIEGFAGDIVIQDQLISVANRAAQVAARALEYMELGKRWKVFVDDDGPVVERQLTVQVGEDTDLTGFIDLVLVDNDGAVLLVDWKTTTRPKSIDDYMLDMQLPIYAVLWALNNPTSFPDKIGIIQVRDALPVRPSINKNGSVSKSKSIITDWDTYAAVIDELGLDRKDYNDMRLFLETEKGPEYWFNEFWVPFTSATIQAYVTNMLQAVHYIQTLQNEYGTEDLWPGAFGWACRGCAFRQLCLTNMQDGMPIRQIVEESENFYFYDREDDTSDND